MIDAPFRSEFREVNGTRLRVSVRGNGPPLLLIMGIGGNIEMWEPFRRALHTRAIQTIAFDAPGTGESPSQFPPRRMGGLATLADGLLANLGVDNANVLGISFGGFVAQELALRHPRRIARLILASTACGVGSIPGNPLSMGLLATPLRYYSPRFVRAVSPMLYGTSAPSVDAEVHFRRSRPPTIVGYAGQLAAVAGWSSLPRLRRIATPTLVMSGGRDPLVPAINARMLTCAIRGARLHLVADGGHLLLLDRPDECATVVANFLAEAPTIGPA